MTYPVDIGREMQRSSLFFGMAESKAAIFRRLLEEINGAYQAGLDGEAWAPWDEDVNASLLAVEAGGMSGEEKRTVRRYIREINRAYLCGAGRRGPAKTYPQRLEDEIRACLEGEPKWCSPMELLRAAYDEIKRLNALTELGA